MSETIEALGHETRKMIRELGEPEKVAVPVSEIRELLNVLIIKLEMAHERPDATPAEAPQTRSDILNTADHYVNRDRAATHGDAEDSFGRIAGFWSSYLDTQVTAADVAVMMNLLKCARIRNNPGHADNWIDACGYMACGGEIAIGE